MATGLRAGKTVADEDWVLDFCRFREAWALPPPRPEGRQKGEGLTVIHPDTGYTGHPELLQDDRYHITDGIARNFIPVGNRESQAHNLPALDKLDGSSASHGTKTASVMMSAEGGPDPVIFASYSAPKAIWGVAPKVKVIPYRVSNWVNLDDASCIRLARAIYYAVRNEDLDQVGAISISLGRASLGMIEDESYIRKAMQAARAAGVIVCVAGGQLQQRWMAPGPSMFSPVFPGRDPNAISVAGCQADHKAIPSGFLGPEVDVTAPADAIWAARANRGNPRFDVEQSWGTSYAAAITAGACALWQAHHGRVWLLDPANYGPELIFKLFKVVLARSTHKPTGWDSAKRGVGVLDAEALLAEPLPSKADLAAIADE